MRGLTAVLLGILAWPFQAHAAVFFVTSTADSGAGSLRSAITAANGAGAGAHEVRFDGAFPQNGLILLGSTLPAVTAASLTIHGNGFNPTIAGNQTFQLLKTGANVLRLELNGLTFSAGRAELDPRGGCLSSTESDQGELLIHSSTFDDCTVVGGETISRGGAVHWRGRSVTIRDSVFTYNYVSVAASGSQSQASGGAVYTSANLLVERSVFRTNTVMGRFGSGGALSAHGDIVDIRDSHFFDNFAVSLASSSPSSLGGAVTIDCFGCVGTLERNVFNANYSTTGGAVYLRGNTAPTATRFVLENNTFFDNEALGSGGALSISFPDVRMRHNTFHNNKAAESKGAHLHLNTVQLQDAANNVLGVVARGRACEGFTTIFPTIAGGNYASDSSCAQAIPGIQGNAALTSADIDTSHTLPAVRFAAGSVVIDGGDAAGCLPDDMHGNARPVDGDGDGVARCDAGAYEHALDDTIFADGFEPLP
jgi:hypothetical protein